MNAPRLRPRVLVLDEELPWPPDTGKRIRTLNLLERLAGQFAIDLLVHDSGASGPAIEQLRARGIEPHLAPSRLPAKRGPLFAARLALNLLSPLPYSVASHYRRGYRAALARLRAEREYDLLHCEWTPYARYVLDDPLPRVIAAHNVESQVWERLAAVERSGARRAFLRLQARRMARFERRAVRAAGRATAVSAEDAAALRRMGCGSVAVVPNGVDTDHFRPGEPGREQAHQLVFTGSMDWRPNQDALRWFVDAVLPLLRRGGSVRLTVVGRNPPPELARPGALPPEVVLTGTVPDVRPFVSHAAVFVVPLRVGGGSRLKILEALAMERAVVSTTIGAEGLDTTEGRDIVLADDPAGFADAVERLMADEARRRALGRAGRALVLERYGWDAIAKIQAEFWLECVDRSRLTEVFPAGPRRLSSSGSMPA
ncbi:MAG: glycosyltransferase [Acidobacteria bacterium]|nr:glycosyltransferase [Acidobacteriota bacterium]